MPLARQKDACGPEVYARASRHYLGAAVDLREAYAWSWEELARLRAEMARVSNLVRPGATVAEAMAILDEDPARRVEGRENFRSWMQEQAERTIAELDGTHFDIPRPAHRIEALIAPTNDGGIYYTGPSDDWSRPGRMWWSVPDGVETSSTWKEVTVVYHEGVPGHHLQISHAMAETESLNRWQRMAWVSGHGEGWALYAERLMGELGYLDDPGAYLGMLDSQQLLCAQVALDIGVHLELDVPRGAGWREGERWNAELAWEILRAHSSWDERQLRSELRRCLGLPGQAPSYKLGERIWLQATEDAKARAGAAFSLKDFHAKALSLGAMGLDPLREAARPRLTTLSKALKCSTPADTHHQGPDPRLRPCEARPDVCTGAGNTSKGDLGEHDPNRAARQARADLGPGGRPRSLPHRHDVPGLLRD